VARHCFGSRRPFAAVLGTVMLGAPFGALGQASPPADANGRASFTYTPDTAGFHEIEVYAVAANGIVSDWAFYDFQVTG